MIELILGESTRIVRRRGAFLVCETRHGFVCAAAGVDRSNTGEGDVAILLPVDPDASARRPARGVRRRRPTSRVIVTDSFGRPFRLGTTGVAVGCAGLAPVRVHTGESDDAGRVLQGTEVHVADQVASAAELVRRPVRRRARRGRARRRRTSAPTRARGAGLMPRRARSLPGMPANALDRVRAMTLSDKAKALFRHARRLECSVS